MTRVGVLLWVIATVMAVLTALAFHLHGLQVFVVGFAWMALVQEMRRPS